MIAFVVLSGRQVITWSFLVPPPAGPLSFAWLLHLWSALGLQLPHSGLAGILSVCLICPSLGQGPYPLLFLVSTASGQPHECLPKEGLQFLNHRDGVLTEGT